MMPQRSSLRTFAPIKEVLAPNFSDDVIERFKKPSTPPIHAVAGPPGACALPCPAPQGAVKVTPYLQDMPIKFGCALVK